MEIVGGVDDDSVGESGAVERRGGDGRGSFVMRGYCFSGWLLCGSVNVVGGSDAWGTMASSLNG